MLGVHQVSGGFSPPLPTTPLVRVRKGRFTVGYKKSNAKDKLFFHINKAGGCLSADL